MNMKYSQKTQDLIDRQCRVAERKDFILDKKLAEETIMKTYDLFNLERPKNTKWFVDLSSKEWHRLASSARPTWSNRPNSSAVLAWLSSSAVLASSNGSSDLARSAWLDSSANSTRSNWFALNYNFDLFVFVFQYKEDPTNGPINKNDIKYLEYCELLLQAKEAGLGYMIECEDTLYLVPSPIVRLNEQSPPQYHSDQLPAIEWAGGAKIYFLDGVHFKENLWKKVVSKKMTYKEIRDIGLFDQRTVALKYNPQAIKEKYSWE